MERALTTTPDYVEPRTSLGLNSTKLGMWLYIGSEIILFSALIASFLMFRVRMPAGVNHVLNVPVTAVNTFILLASSFTVVMALEGIRLGRRRRLQLMLLATLLLGAFFLGSQVNEYMTLYREGFTITANTFGTTFFILTGIHGAHVFVGLVWRLITLLLAARGRFTAEKNLGVELFGLYWHFVDIVWIFLFVLLYLI